MFYHRCCCSTVVSYANRKDRQSLIMEVAVLEIKQILWLGDGQDTSSVTGTKNYWEFSQQYLYDFKTKFILKDLYYIFPFRIDIKSNKNSCYVVFLDITDSYFCFWTKIKLQSNAAFRPCLIIWNKELRVHSLLKF